MTTFSQHRLRIYQSWIQNGEVIAYPTEGVFGLGCRADLFESVEKVKRLKERDSTKGLILLVTNLSQISPWIEPISSRKQSEVNQHWPGSTTFLFRKSANCPDYLTGKFNTLAVRVSGHPLARILSREYPLVSTSANRAGQTAAIYGHQVLKTFKNTVKLVPGHVQIPRKTSMIIDVESGRRLR